MKLYLILLLIWCINTNSICIKPLQIKSAQGNSAFSLKSSNFMGTLNDERYKNRSARITNFIKRKTDSYLRLIRYKNIFPTVLLSFTGGWIMNPSIDKLRNSKEFIISVINTIIIMSSSMVINDIFDIEVDKINNPERPLITGEITRNEAILFAGSLLSLCEFLSIKFLPFYLQFIVHLSIINVVIYTKILKPMFLIKNISCAFLVSFSLFFSGISSTLVYDDKKLELLRIAIRLIFFGSLHNEILLDMCDVRGDKKNNIQTLPVVYGVEHAWKCAYLITYFNMLWNSFHLMRLFNYKIGILLLFTCSPLLNNLLKVEESTYSTQISKYAVNESTKPLFMCLFYLCWLANIG